MILVSLETAITSFSVCGCVCRVCACVCYLFYTAEFVHSALVAVHTVLSQVEMGRILKSDWRDTVSETGITKHKQQ